MLHLPTGASHEAIVTSNLKTQGNKSGGPDGSATKDKPDFGAFVAGKKAVTPDKTGDRNPADMDNLQEVAEEPGEEVPLIEEEAVPLEVESEEIVDFDHEFSIFSDDPDDIRDGVIGAADGRAQPDMSVEMGMAVPAAEIAPDPVRQAALVGDDGALWGNETGGIPDVADPHSVGGMAPISVIRDALSDPVAVGALQKSKVAPMVASLTAQAVSPIPTEEPLPQPGGAEQAAEAKSVEKMPLASRAVALPMQAVLSQMDVRSLMPTGAGDMQSLDQAQVNPLSASGLSAFEPGSGLRGATQALYAQPDLPRNVAQQITAVVHQGPDRASELMLSPVELGRVRISLTTHEAGVIVNVMAERPETLDLMRRHVAQLAQEFRDIGYDSAEFSFGQDQPKGQSGPVQGDTTDHAALDGGETPDQQARLNPVRTVALDRVDIRL